MKKWICLFLLGLLTSCASTSYFSIDTFNPATLTFPSTVKKLLIVNNANPQPSTSGYEYKLLGMVQDTAKASADSAAFDLCRTLGETIVASPYYEDVLLYDGIYRQDKSYLSDERLPPERVEELCEANGVDAVVSLDRLLFKTKRTIRAVGSGYLEGAVDVDLAGILRIYLPGQEKIWGTILLGDSLRWEEAALSKEEMEIVLPPTEECLRAAGRYEGEKSYVHFVPFWESETRWYYKEMSSRWKEAYAYAKDGKLDKAAGIWADLFEKTSDAVRKAKAAANIAVCRELQGNLEEALKWAEEATGLLGSEAGEENQYALYQKAYA